MRMRLSALILIFCQRVLAADFYVHLNGSDQTGDGSIEKPWRTILFAVKKIPARQNHTLKISPGTFFESASIEIPLQVNLEGAGTDLTIIKAAKSFYYNPPVPKFMPDRFLIRLEGFQDSERQQVLEGFTIDGSNKQLHGGIYVNGRNHVDLENIKVQNTNFCGIWILKTKNSALKKVTLLNCAWGNNDWCSGALQFAHVDHVEFDQVNIDEGKGYGIKSLGHDTNHVVRHLKIHDSKISVNPKGLWQNGKAPNISIEIWASSLPESEIFNCSVDNHISLVNNAKKLTARGSSFRVHHNIIDLKTRAKGEGYGIELAMDNVEVDHNIFIGGLTGIVNWGPQKAYWKIHHNVFYGIDNPYPTAVINAQNGNFKQVEIYNNTIELSGKATVNFIGCSNGGISEDVKIFNNLIINSSVDYTHYPNHFIRLEKNATIKNLIVENNLLFNLTISDIEGTFRNNISKDPLLTGTGKRPFPYYLPTLKSPAIDAGRKFNDPYKGIAPDIGAYEVK